MSLRRFRLRAVWLLVVPFLLLSRPTPLLVAVGALVALAGLALRAWAAGVIEKERDLATGGPYAHTRNPLYLGSLLLGAGVTTAGGHWVWPALFLAFYVVAYGRAMAAEERLLEERFGQHYRSWAAGVPAFLPRITPWREAGKEPDAFTWARYRRNREWEAALGALAGFGLLALKAWRAAG